MLVPTTDDKLEVYVTTDSHAGSSARRAVRKTREDVHLFDGAGLTVMGGHDPRVKYFVRPGRNQPSFSVLIADPPRVVANSLPDRVLRERAPEVIRWVAINKDGLLDFWTNGDTWADPQVTAFKQALKRI